MNNDTLPFESGKCAQGWCEVSLMAETKKETSGVLADGRNHMYVYII